MLTIFMEKSMMIISLFLFLINYSTTINNIPYKNVLTNDICGRSTYLPPGKEIYYPNMPIKTDNTAIKVFTFKKLLTVVKL